MSNPAPQTSLRSVDRPYLTTKYLTIKLLAKILGIIAITSLLGAYVLQRNSDGPSGPIPGGELRQGAWVGEAVVDWRFAHNQEVQLQLLDPLSSRTTGILVHDGVAYIPCDLGFIWARLAGSQRWILNLIYLFKNWHEQADLDGRAVLRIDGQRYPVQLVRVTDLDLNLALRQQLEMMAAELFAAGALPPAPSEGPQDVWFFRIQPRGLI